MKFIFLAFCLAMPQLSLGHVLILTHFDSILESREEFGGTFSTPRVLFKRHKGLIYSESLSDGPEEIQVNPREYKKMLPYLAKGMDYSGSKTQKFIIESLGKDNPIVAGDYFERWPDTIKYFFSPPKGVASYLMRDVKTAYEKDPQQKFKGPAWPILQAVLNDKELSKSLAIYSSRSHSVDEFAEVFQFISRKENWQHTPLKNHYFPLGQTEFNIFGSNASDRKADFIAHVVYELSRVPLTETDLRISADGDQVEKNHLIFLTENQQDSWIPVVNKLQALIRGKFAPIKIVLFHAGTSEELKTSPFINERVSVMTSSGFLRPLLAAEYAEMPFISKSMTQKTIQRNKKSARSLRMSCRQIGKTKGFM